MNEIFEEIYNKIYQSSKDRLDEVRKSNNSFIIKIVIISIVFIVCFAYMVDAILAVALGLILLIIVTFLISCSIRDYKEIYKQEVIEALLKGYNDKIKFDAKGGITRNEYTDAHFDNCPIDEVLSEDKITGRLKDESAFMISDVVARRIEVHGQGRERTEERITIFKGLYGRVNLRRNSTTQVTIIRDESRRRFDKKRIEIDSAEFENKYDFVTTDRVYALRIFTSDVIEKFNDLEEHGIKVPFELKIDFDKVFFRLKCGSMFEPPTFKNALDKELLRGYFNVVYQIIELLEKVTESINNISITN